MKKVIKISSTEDGLFLNDFILSFDSCRSKHISFLSSALNPFLDISARIITTEETLRILNMFNRHPNALICQYNRAFSVGKLKIELLPSGGILGGASLFVETEGNSLIYAPLLRTKSFVSLRSMQLKPANVLIINALHPINVAAKVRRKNEIERLLNLVEKDIQSDRWPIIICPPVGIAQELTYLFSEKKIPISVHSSIYKVQKVYESFASQVGEYKLFKAERKENSVLLLPQSRLLRTFPKIKQNRPCYSVHKDFVGFDDRSREVDDKFYLNLHADLEDIKHTIIPEVRPKRLMLFGPYAKSYAEELRPYVASVSIVFQDNQPALF